jgi:hypothetical protein
MCGIVLLTIVGVSFSTYTFAEDSSSDEVMRLKAENAKLRKALEKKSDEEPANTPKKTERKDEVESKFWSGIAVKLWSETFSPGDGSSRNLLAPQLSFTAGYEKWFINYSTSTFGLYNEPNLSNSWIKHGQGGVNIGYIPIPGLLVALGSKYVEETWNFPSKSISAMTPSGTPQDIPLIPKGGLYFTTIGASYSHSLGDSPYSISGGVTYGQRTITVDTTKFTGSAGGSSTYLGYDIGVAYDWTNTTKLSLYYRVEQWDAELATTVYAQPAPYLADVTMTRMTSSGPGVGISWSF